MKKQYAKITAILFLSIAVINGCNTVNSDDEVQITADVIADVPANVNTLIEGFPENYAGVSGDEEVYSYYDLDKDRRVNDPESSDWDIAFDGTRILANYAHGGGIMVVEEDYSDVKEAPTSGYTDENDNWYIYTAFAEEGPQHAIIPKENYTLVVKTPEGRYAKIKMKSYYLGNPDVDSEEFENLDTRPEPEFYTFEYTLQSDEESNKLYHIDDITYYSLENQRFVEDAESSEWDLAFNATEIYGNTEHGGGVMILNMEFKNAVEAPEEGYTRELSSNWYEYTMFATSGPQHAILPLPGKTIFVKTPNGNYGKIRIISYYKGNPDTSSDDFMNFIRPLDRYYTFEYELRTDGSRIFEDE